jgi:hypothetical protein
VGKGDVNFPRGGSLMVKRTDNFPRGESLRAQTFPTRGKLSVRRNNATTIYKDDVLKSHLVRCSVLKSQLVGKFCSLLPAVVVGNQPHTETLKLGRSLLLRSDDADFLNERILLYLL